MKLIMILYILSVIVIRRSRTRSIRPGRSSQHYTECGVLQFSRDIIIILLSPRYYHNIIILLFNAHIMLRLLWCAGVSCTAITTSNLRRDYRGCNMTITFGADETWEPQYYIIIYNDIMCICTRNIHNWEPNAVRRRSEKTLQR